MSNMIKRAFVQVEGTEKLMIDSNRQVMDRMDEIINSAPAVFSEDPVDEEGSDEFREGLLADRVEMLTDTDMAEGEEALAESPSDDIGGDATAAAALSSEEAERIIAEAEESARAIMEEAEQSAAAIKESARNEGYEAGHDEGYQAGMQETELEKEKIRELAEALEADYRKKSDELEPMLVDTLSGIYSHIFHVEMEDRKDIILYLLQSALMSADAGSGLIIHVSKDDHSLLIEKKDELLNGIPGADNVEIVEDMTLKSGECFIDTGGGIFDCSLETELKGLRKELKLLSYESSGTETEDG